MRVLSTLQVRAVDGDTLRVGGERIRLRGIDAPELSELEGPTAKRRLEELLRKSLFHAVFEATKGVSERLRQMTGISGDGAGLVDQCFGGGSGVPVVRINGYRTESEISEHRGFANLLRGIFGTFRNPPAHTPRATEGWVLTEADALDLFSMLSLVHRRLDAARFRPPEQRVEGRGDPVHALLGVAGRG